MSLDKLYTELEGEVAQIHSNSFEFDITETTSVPNHSDSNLTFANFDKNQKKVKKLKTALLFIDIRKSSKISLANDATTMAKLYTSFTRAMIRIAEYHGGYVRNIIGDRIMVAFDYGTCATKSLETAVAMNKVTNEIINKSFKNNRISCGIGIDCGEVLVTKCGVIKRGEENAHYKNLTWSGTIANTASKLTDQANKYTSSSKVIHGANVGFIYPWNNGDWTWEFYDTERLISELKKGITYSPVINFPDKYFQSLFHTTKLESDSYKFPAILLTESVKHDLLIEKQDHSLLKKIFLVDRKIKDVDKKIYGIF